MLKLKRIDLLTKNIVVTTYKSIRNLSAYVEKRRRVGMGGWLQFGREEVG